MTTTQIVPRGSIPRGRAGQVVDNGIRTNLFKISLPSQRVTFSQYDVSIQLPGGRTNKEGQAGQATGHAKPVPKRFFKPIIDFLQTRSPHTAQFNPPGAYDGGALLFVPESRLGGGGQFMFDMDAVDRPDREQFRTSEEDEKDNFVVTLTRTGVVIKRSLIEDAINGRANADGSTQAINAVNAVVRMAPFEQQSDYSLATKRAFFNPKPVKNLQGGLVLLAGFFSSVRPAIGSLVLNLDTTSTVTYRPGSLVDFCLEVLDTHNARDLEASNFKPRKASELMSVLKRVKVAFNKDHPLGRKRMTAGQPKRYGVIGLTKDGADVHHFSYDDRNTNRVREITIKNYFLEKYNYRLRLPAAFCVRLKAGGNEIVLPLELLDVPDGQVYKSTLNARAATEMINATKRSPRDRLREIQGALGALRYESSQYMRGAGMNMSPQPSVTAARLLPPPEVMFAERQLGNVRQGGWDALRKKYARPATIKGWAVVVMDPSFRRSASPQHFMDSYVQPLRDTLVLRGLQILVDPIVWPTFNNQGDVAQQLHALLDNILTASTQFAVSHGYRGTARPLGVSDVLIICILNNPDSYMREKVKTWSEVVSGAATQIVVGSKYTNPKNLRTDGQYLNNLALKINLKMGGMNSIVTNAWFGTERKPAPRTMILGVDVSHPSPGSDAPSIAALVFNISPRSMVDFASTTRVQQTRNEIVVNFADMLHEAFMAHEAPDAKGNRRPPPERIVIFRDGVSEGEFETVFSQELGALKEYVRRRKLPVPPKITFIVVGKRHHVRFFPAERGNMQQQDHKNGNLPSGLVVDDEIVHPLYRDFYLQSQKPLMGTSRSAHYTVLYDENAISQDDLQKFSFDLCHAFGRSTTAVSLPAPVYYADLVCARARLHLSGSNLGSEGSLISDTGRVELDAATLAELNAKTKVIDRQKRRMYFM